MLASCSSLFDRGVTKPVDGIANCLARLHLCETIRGNLFHPAGARSTRPDSVGSRLSEMHPLPREPDRGLSSLSQGTNVIVTLVQSIKYGFQLRVASKRKQDHAPAAVG